jgi:hypothetical protein
MPPAGHGDRRLCPPPGTGEILTSLACAMLAGRPRLAVEGRAWEKPPAGAGEVEAACGLPGAGPLPMRRERHAPGAATAASSRSMRGTGLSVAPHPLLRLAAVPAAGVWPAPVMGPVARPGLERHNRMTWSGHRHGRRRSQPRRSARCFGLPGARHCACSSRRWDSWLPWGKDFWRLPRQPARPDQLGTIRPRAGLLLMRGLAAAGQAGGAKNSRAIPSGSRNETPEP